MSYVLHFPGSRDEPAEYESDNPFYCADCGEEFDLDDDVSFEVEVGSKKDPERVCEDCRFCCDFCGEWIDAMPELGPLVAFRESADNVKTLAHAMCAAEQMDCCSQAIAEQ